MAAKAVALAALLLAGIPGARAQDLLVGPERIADATEWSAAKAEGKVVLYGTYPSDLMAPILAAFKSDTGIATEYLRLTSQILFPRVTSEFAANRLAADYVDLTDPTLVRQLVEKGVLAKPFKVPGFDGLPAPLHDPDGRWYTLIRPVGVIGVNNAVVQSADLPSRWTDLLDPKWQGQIGMPSIETGGSAFIPYVFLREKVAPDYWMRLAKQQPHIYPSAAPTEQDLVRGETSLIIGTTSLVSQVKAGAPVTIVFPTEGVPAFPISGGIVSSAPHPHAAGLFLAWMTSSRAAGVIGDTGSYGINPNAKPPAPQGIAFPPVAKVWNMPFAQWEQQRQTYQADWQRVFKR